MNGEITAQPNLAARLFLGLVAGQLLLAGLLQFDLQAYGVLEVLYQWAMILVGGAGVVFTMRAYRRSGWRTRHPAVHRILLTALATTVGSAGLLFLLHMAAFTHTYEVERYLRAFLLSISVYLFANAAVVFLGLGLLYLLTKRLWASIAIGLTVTGLLHGFHVAKYLILQQHLYVWDYMLVGDMLEVLPRYAGAGGETALLVLAASLVVGIAVLAWREAKGESLKRRAALVGGGLIATALLWIVTALSSTGPNEDPSEYFPLWNRHSYNSHYNKTGFHFALLRGSRYFALNSAPEGYSDEAMARIERTYPRGKNTVVPTADVIFYMVESLADYAEYGLAFEPDPLANFHALQRAHTRGRLIVPIFGGNTPNTEFEMLTGLSRVRPWPYDLSYAYRQWITGKTAALPWVFRDWGYQTAVVSGARDRYFGEVTAYPRLGFEQFRALGDVPGLPRKFGLVSDEAVVDDLIQLLSQEGPDRKPWFLSVTTDATHGPYRGAHVPSPPRFVLTTQDLPDDVVEVATDHAHAIHHADEHLGRLVAFLKSRSRPTILFVYGDHKPALDEFFAAGILRDGWPGRLLDKYSTPLAIWSNLPHVKPSNEPLVLSANFLSAELFTRLGVKHPPSTFHFTKRVYATFPIVSRVIGDRAGTFHHPEDLRGTEADLLRDYGFVKYHTLVGGRGN